MANQEASRTLRRSLLITALLLLSPTLGSAHKLVLLSDNFDGVIPIIGSTPHLAGGPLLDLGSVPPGQATSQTFVLSNVSGESLSVSLGAQAPFSVTPTGSLQLAPGAEVSVTVAFNGTGGPGDLQGQLVASSSHAGLTQSHDETWPIAVHVQSPPVLRLHFPTLGESDVSVVELGYLSNEAGVNEVEFPMTIENVGEATAKDVRFVQPGGRNVSGWDCSAFEVELPLTFCVSLNGALPQGFEVPGTASGTGNSVELTWRFVPERDGFFGQDFQLTSDNGATKSLRLRGGVVNLDFGSNPLLTGTDGQVQGLGENPTFARRSDPFGGDPFDSFAPSGFDAKTAFAVGDFDHVETRSGNLLVTIPLGGEVRSAGGLSYSLSAVFNGRVWAQETMYRTDAIERTFPDDDQGPVHSQLYDWAYTAEYFDPTYNNGQGWSVHLGRLIVPDSNFFQGGDGSNPLDPASWEGRVRSGVRYVYVDPAGTKREFYRALHGEEIYRDCPDSCYEKATYLYTRDGSYLRLERLNASTRVLEFPDGTQHTFKKGGHPTLLEDDWRLTSMNDRQGNLVSISYGTNLWTITEAVTGRKTEVEFRAGSGGRLQVKEVRVPGFGSATAVRKYSFNYGSAKTIARSPRSTWHGYLINELDYPIDPNVKFDPLTSVTRPDGTSWSFTYSYGSANDDLTLDALTLPTGAKVDYDYAVVRNPPPYCANGFNRGALAGVVRRTVRDRDQTKLEDTRFLRQYRAASSVPSDVCLAQPGVYSPYARPPLAEQRTAVWSLHESTSPALSSVAVDYYSVYPLQDVCVEGTEGCTTVGGPGGKGEITAGWTHVENGVQMTRSEPDPAWADGTIAGERYLSAELYECKLSFDLAIPDQAQHQFDPINGPFVGDDIDTLLDNASCDARSSTYRGYEVERAGDCGSNVQELCLKHARLIDERTVYHTDPDATGTGHWRRTASSDFDGLGNYRSTDVSSNFEENGTVRTEQSSYQNTNPSVGALVLDEEYKVDAARSTFTVPDTWILGLTTDHWVQGAYGGRYGGTFHHRSDGLVDLARIYEGSGPGEKDLVVSYEYDAYGNVTAERHFGADVYFDADGKLPTGSGWTAATNWPSSLQDYAVVQTWDKGFLETRRVDGSSVYEVNRTIDPGTGWTLQETQNHGETLTYSYDGLGRVTGIDSNRGTDVSVAYTEVPRGTGQSWWQSTVTTTGRPDPASSGVISVSYIVNHDDLGRVVKQSVPASSGSGRIDRWTAYHPSGQVKGVSVPGDAAHSTQFRWDVEGQLVERTGPDGHTVTKYVNISPRRVRMETWGASGPKTGHAKTVFDFDPLGRVVRVQRPHEYTATDGTKFQARTRYDYDGLGQLVHAWNGTQDKHYGRDGRGFLTSEQIPELSGDGTTGFVETRVNSFDTRGNPLVVEKRRIGGGWLRRTRTRYDNLGRPTLVEAKDNVSGLGSYRPLKSFTYHGSGNGNGLLASATRHNYRTATTGGSSWGAGDWRVTSGYGYDALGRLRWREVELDLVTASGSSLAGPVTSVWEYDDFGNPVRAGYPDASCLASSIGACTAGDAAWTYSQGTYLTDATLYQPSGNSQVVAASAAFSYHASGLVSTIARSFGGTDTYTQPGDGMPRIGSVNLGSGLRNLGTYTYDDRGLITKIGSDAFGYDLDGRLTGATVNPAPGHGSSVSQAYGYDRWDNFDPTSGMGVIDQTTNRFVGPTYDDHGNATVLGGGLFLLDYDQLDKHISTREYDGSGVLSNQVLSIYDHQDLRVVRYATSNPRQEWTLRDPGGHVIREMVISGGVLVPTQDYLWAHGELVASKDYETGVRSQYHTDHLGTARLISRVGTTGVVSSEYVDYLPFGEALPENDPGERIAGFTGHESDGTTTYMRGRSYLQTLGKFVQIDPGREGWNGYAYGNNNPVNRFDPNGRAGQSSAKKKRVKLFDPSGGSAAHRFNSIRDQKVMDALVEGGSEAGEEAFRDFNKDMEGPAFIVAGVGVAAPVSVPLALATFTAGTTAYATQRIDGDSDRDAIPGTVAAMLFAPLTPVKGAVGAAGAIAVGVGTTLTKNGLKWLRGLLDKSSDSSASTTKTEPLDISEASVFVPLDLEIESDDVRFQFDDDPE